MQAAASPLITNKHMQISVNEYGHSDEKITSALTRRNMNILITCTNNYIFAVGAVSFRLILLPHIISNLFLVINKYFPVTKLIKTSHWFKLLSHCLFKLMALLPTKTSRDHYLVQIFIN